MRYLPWLPGVGSGPSTRATFVGGSFFEITKRAVVEWDKFCRREFPISICICHKLPFLFCSPDQNFLQITTLSCTLLLIFLILVCFGCFFCFAFFFSSPFFDFRKSLSTLFVFCSKYLSELHSRHRYFR